MLNLKLISAKTLIVYYNSLQVAKQKQKKIISN